MQLSPVTHAPATCIFCRRSPQDGEHFVDTLVSLDNGPVSDRAYVCRECGGQIANAYGWVDPRDHAQLLEDTDAQAERLIAVQAELDASKEDTLSWIKGVVAEAKPASTRKPRVQPSS